MKLLVTGAGGQVGREVLCQARAAGHEVVAADRRMLDITDGEAVRGALARHAPHLVVNAAAYTAVDHAESEPEAAFAINRDGAARLAAACAGAGVPLVHFSTDYVFDGTKSGAYVEEDAACPANVYGKSKWEGEEAVRNLLGEHVILRVSWVFGVQGQNFVRTVLRLAGERPELRVVADQFGCPTPASDVAAAVLRVAADVAAAGAPWGTYHFCGQPATTWHGFAEAVLQEWHRQGAKPGPAVVPIATEEYPAPARRPVNSVLDPSRFHRRFGMPARQWRHALPGVVAALTEADPRSLGA
jgi:dTDP-4-dehydrorhamnose reductase